MENQRNKSSCSDTMILSEQELFRLQKYTKILLCVRHLQQIPSSVLKKERMVK